MTRTELLEARRRRQIASTGGKAARDKRLLQSNYVALWFSALDAVETLFKRIRSEQCPFALVYLLGDVCVMRTDNKDYLRVVVLHPEALIGVYDERTTRHHVFDDMSEIPALALAKRKAA